MTVFLNHWPLWSHFEPASGWELTMHEWLAGIYQAFIQLTWPTGGQHPALVAFFVLSGFCVHAPFARRSALPGWRPDWRDYMVRRLQRIMPVYWIGVTLGVLFVLAEYWWPTGDTLLRLHSDATVVQVFARYGGWAGLWPEEIFAGNYILHTVATEILIYAAYPLIFMAAVANRWILLGAVAVCMHLLVLPLMRWVDPFVLFPGVLMMGLFWYLGALAAHLHERRAWRVPGWWPAGLWAVFLALQQTPHFYGLNLIKQFVCGLICMTGIVWFIAWEKRHEAWRNSGLSRLLRWTGDISYPLYAVHTPVILLVNWALLTFSPVRSYAWQLTINLFSPVLVTVVVHYAIERRFYRARTAG